MSKRKSLGCGCGLGSTPEKHRVVANRRLRDAGEALERAMHASSCSDRMTAALDAFANATAADVELVAAGDKALAAGLAQRAVVAMASCVQPDAPASKPQRHLRLVRGGQRGRR